jgi:hypothetical protein
MSAPASSVEAEYAGQLRALRFDINLTARY